MADDTENIRTLWSIRMEDIRFFKKQQYAVANYGLLLLAAIVAARDELIPTNTTALPLRGFCVVAMAAVVAGAVWQIRGLQDGLRRARKDRNLARNHLADSHTALRLILESPVPENEREHGDVEILLLAVVFIGAILAVGFVLKA